MIPNVFVYLPYRCRWFNNNDDCQASMIGRIVSNMIEPMDSRGFVKRRTNDKVGS